MPGRILVECFLAAFALEVIKPLIVPAQQAVFCGVADLQQGAAHRALAVGLLILYLLEFFRVQMADVARHLFGLLGIQRDRRHRGFLLKTQMHLDEGGVERREHRGKIRRLHRRGRRAYMASAALLLLENFFARRKGRLVRTGLLASLRLTNRDERQKTEHRDETGKIFHDDFLSGFFMVGNKFTLKKYTRFSG